MTRSTFGTVLLGLAGITALSGCKSRISKSAYNAELGDPYLCDKCGHLFRSKEDMSTKHCPRCYAKALKKISEEDAEKLLAESGQS
jgi:predicted Zn-ribbon and HTH transcriptional regulator